jgi:protein-cysteine N-palmitoyltransferase HHAT
MYTLLCALCTPQIIWRLSRLWALLDGVSPYENMQGCIVAATSVASFWNRWHCSFNQWLVRYLYVPLGGRKAGAAAVFPVFVFVALWHDAVPALLAWGLLNGAFIVAESAVQRLYNRSRNSRNSTNSSNWKLDRTIRGAGGALSLLLLAGVNLIGYSVGLQGGVSAVQTALVTRFSDVISVLAVVAVTLFGCTQLVFVAQDARQRLCSRGGSV